MKSRFNLASLIAMAGVAMSQGFSDLGRVAREISDALRPQGRYFKGRHKGGGLVGTRKAGFASSIHAKRGMQGIPGNKLLRKADKGLLGVRSKAVHAR